MGIFVTWEHKSQQQEQQQATYGHQLTQFCRQTVKPKFGRKKKNLAKRNSEEKKKFFEVEERQLKLENDMQGKQANEVIVV